MFVPLVGSSGSGKSSVVFAGLIPELKKNTNWQICSFRPKNRPFYELAASLIPLIEPGMTINSKQFQN